MWMRARQCSLEWGPHSLKEEDKAGRSVVADTAEEISEVEGRAAGGRWERRGDGLGEPGGENGREAALEMAGCYQNIYKSKKQYSLNTFKKNKIRDLIQVVNHKIGLKNQRDIKLFSRGKSVSYRVDPQ